jgi:hypothetical protein
VQQHGRNAMTEAERKRDRLLDQMARQAEHLIQTHSAARRLH